MEMRPLFLKHLVLAHRFLLFVCLFALIGVGRVQAQVENVPVNHPVYLFLKRLSVKQFLPEYSDVVLPISRRQTASMLRIADKHAEELTKTERALLKDYATEFQFDLAGSVEGMHRLIQSPAETFGETVEQYFSEREKFLYFDADSTLSFFVDGLLTLDTRRSRTDALGSPGATFMQFGGRIRGTIGDHLGYYLQGTNAQFWGSREVLLRDRFIGQSYTINVGDTKNFDHVEGYVRYDGGVVSAQLGRERILWGTGYGDRFILSDNVRQFDFIRASAAYKSLRYEFLHAWLLGNRRTLTFTLPTDPTHLFYEPENADKYFAGHRLALVFPAFEFGFQEMVIYSNRSVDLAFLNPVTLIESAQRAREERDNVLWAFDCTIRPMHGFELRGSILLDDLNFPKWGTGSVQNKNAFQAGLFLVDPAGLANSSLAIEYTRIEPYTFSHERSRDNNYGSGNRILTHHIGPNADSWFTRLDYLFSHRVSASVQFEYVRSGENLYDATSGILLKNVGGDFLQPHRAGKDSPTKEFLGGNFTITRRFGFLAIFEAVNEVFIDARYDLLISSASLKGGTLEQDFGIMLRLDF